MNPDELRARLLGVPDPEVAEPPEILRAIDDEVAYLASDAALASLAEDTYWPKWRTPWWGMLLLHELGEARRIPARTVEAMVEGLDALPHTCPIRPEDWPPGADPHRYTRCHCALGCMDQVLAACGVDVDHALPWIAPWFARYQMADGGLSCDETAYLVAGECPSSMVGTIAPFEALIRRGPSEACDRAAAFLIERELQRGSATAHNAGERVAAAAWGAPCFPRFYFYDVLRGAAALARWAVAHARVIPLGAIAPVVEHLLAQFPDGIVRVERAAFAGKSTLARGADGAWTRRPAETSPLLDAASRLGAPSAALTREWTATRGALVALVDRGQISPRHR